MTCGCCGSFGSRRVILPLEQPGLHAGRRSESRPEPLIYLFASPKWNDDTMSEEGGVHQLLIRDHKKKVDLVHCTCWAGVRKRWRNTSSLSMHPCPSVHQTHAYLLTCMDASALSPVPLLSWVVYVRAHQITLACLHAPGGPAVSRRTTQLEIEHCLEFLNGYKIVQEVYRPSGIRRALHKSLFETRSTWQRTTFVLTNSHKHCNSKSCM